MSDGLIAGRFRLRRLLGSGGTASVFEADDRVRGEAVALKLLHPHLAVGPAAWDAFFEEVRAAGAIAHPNLAEVFDAGLEPGDPPIAWISMELVPGVSLADHVRDHGPLTVPDAVTIAMAVLDAVGAAHAGGVVHRDITPANIMFGPCPGGDARDGDALARSVRLLDFGLADVPGRTTLGADALLSAATTVLAGVVASVPYASPEQLSGGGVGEASDLYQIGSTLHFALTAHAPFGGDTAAVIRAHVTAPPPVPSARRAGVPRELDRVVTTAMLKRPEDRYPDAAAMRTALAHVRETMAGNDRAAEGEARTSGPEAVTARTRVYRTRLPAAASPGPAVAAVRSDTRAGGPWHAPVIAAALIAAVTAVAGWSAMTASAGTAPVVATSPASPVSAAPTSASPTAAPVPSPRPRVPPLVGLELADAMRVLARAGLVAGDVAREDGAAPVDVVLGSSPGEGESVAEGTTIALRAASGRNTVPSVVGMTTAEAQAALSAAGFPSRVESGGRGAPGTVVSAAPGPGQLLPVGTRVDLRVPPEVAASPAPTPVSPTPSPVATPTVTPSPTDQVRP